MNEKEILETMKELKVKLYKIRCRNWILSKGNGSGAAGRTLEYLLGKEEDRYILPDYCGIELKTKSIYSDYPISLFSCAFDTKPREMYRLVDLYGYPSKDDPCFKNFMISVNAKYYIDKGRYSFKLHVNYETKCLELLIADNFLNIIKTKMEWSFSELRSRLEHKISYLAYVNVVRDRLNGSCYFKYLDASFYKLKGFDVFIKLIDDRVISVSFNISYDRRPEHYGEHLDRGTSFRIKADDLEKLFKKIEI